MCVWGCLISSLSNVVFSLADKFHCTEPLCRHVHNSPVLTERSHRKPDHIITEHRPSQIHRREALLNCGSLLLTVFCVIKVVDVEQQTPQFSSQKK